jgi:uncharacterized protein YbbC (DUF1343 family)
VNSLYGKTQKPTPEMMKDVEVLVFDIQDIGTRFYTYIGTMYYAMQAAKDRGAKFVVLDRPTPSAATRWKGSWRTRNSRERTPASSASRRATA